MMASRYPDMTFENFHYPLLIQDEKLLEKQSKQKFPSHEKQANEKDRVKHLKCSD